MESFELSRRGFVGAAVGLSVVAAARADEVVVHPPQPPKRERFTPCFNTSTIRGQKLPFVDKLALIARAGFTAIEPWLDEIDGYEKEGGSLPELAKRLVDLNLSIESAIGFHEWIVDDDSKRTAALEQAKRDMDRVASLGGKRIAAPPAGAIDQTNMSLAAAAERYAALCAVGRQCGVVPQLELWGFSKTLSRVGEVAYVAAESGAAEACILLDVYHVYKGGSPLESLALINGQRLHVMHMNDYPADPPRATITDDKRVYPGDGIAPLDKILQTLFASGFDGFLSLELFNRDRWNEDPLLVARTGFEKVTAAIEHAFRP